MSNKEKERRCKLCGKLLIDKNLFCRRCFLEWRDKAKVGCVSVGGVAGITAIVIKSQSSK